MATDCVISFGISFTLIAIGNEMLQSRFNYTEEQASFYITMPYFLVGIMTPSLGYLADQIGKRQSILIFGGICNVLSFLLLFLIPDCDRCFWSIIPWVQNALNLSTYQVLQWGSPAYLVAPADLPLAFGILTGY